MHRFMDLSVALRDAVALVGQIEAYRQHFGGNSDPRLFNETRALPSTAEIIARFQDLAPTDRDDKRWALFKDCQRVVNPVQSRLQGPARGNPDLMSLLTQIVSAKSQWAVFDRYPHAALHHAVH